MVYTNKGIYVQEVHRHDTFWKTKIKPFLIQFYKDCLLPEIVDSHLARSMDVRRPDWNKLAIDANKETKNGGTSKATKAKYED